MVCLLIISQNCNLPLRAQGVNMQTIKQKKYKVIGFDADDTLWVNEPYFREAEQNFCDLLAVYASQEAIISALYDTEMQNLAPYGYGIKAFVLSMIETAQQLTSDHPPKGLITQIVNIGKEMLNRPVELLDGVAEVLATLHDASYKLIVATKGDLLDQERKLMKSGLEKYFHHVEIMSDKQPANYRKLLAHLDISGKDFLMVGNSMKSDIIPVVEAGGHAVYIPFHTVWAYEVAEKTAAELNFHEIGHIHELLTLLE